MKAQDLFKALADETRLRSVLLIQREGELCVCELMEALGEAQPKVSRHLAQLRRSGLLADRRQGQWVFYRLHAELPPWVPEMLAQVGQSEQLLMQDALERLANMASRPSGGGDACGSAC
ncbi:metalloregulator ArsR/SmtB family transcription factor [Marinobacterium sediminicola]|uniref:Transcriptional regulator, ArsR family n=1 Tax=Marinobacterium sediminicola TaxID=518898 RepID=A0ABY1RWT0_9GAMM|nr:metalloregulator ArsR/SmtB family transcription factor [Marinobacterium sediminicola]ULG70290.1 metalloregulator ArsR/SmtB family transcription factor [Marinobacterium sediminicola]SMR69830.1 transcriptional regulator, ArsR family [Marinobacterium sediminicola]